jgi:hypothetical protein
MHKLNDIIPPSRRKEMESSNQPVDLKRGPFSPSEKPGGRTFPHMTLIVVALIVVVSIGALFYFSSTKVEVTPNTVSAAVQGSFTATADSGDLSFKIITAQKIASQPIKGSGTKTVNSSASGTITIYNRQSSVQRLVTNTRFATAAGLIFRINSAVTVPGGSSAKPGSISVKVYADKAGTSYNVAPTSFTIPGFAGTPQANEVYARSTSAMTGGASGSVPVVDAALEAQTRNTLAAALAPDLAASIQAQIPAGYTLLKGAATTTHEALASEPSSTAAGMVDVKEQGTITAVVFPSAALAKAVAASVKGLGYHGESLLFAPTNNLVFAPEGGIPDASAPSFVFTLSGTASLVYTVDPARIATAVSGKTRSAAEVALTNFPEVKRAIIMLRPFWRQTFPQDPASISVVVSNP